MTNFKHMKHRNWIIVAKAIGFGVLMSLWDYLMEKEFSMAKFLFLSISFGVILVLVNYFTTKFKNKSKT